MRYSGSSLPLHCAYLISNLEVFGGNKLKFVHSWKSNPEVLSQQPIVRADRVELEGSFSYGVYDIMRFHHFFHDNMADQLLILI